MAVDVLKERGVAEERILFLNLISSPEGIERFSAKFPKLHVITAFIDQACPPPLTMLPSTSAKTLQLTQLFQGLDEKKFVLFTMPCVVASRTDRLLVILSLDLVTLVTDSSPSSWLLCANTWHDSFLLLLSHKCHPHLLPFDLKPLNPSMSACDYLFIL